jgi:polysaccharide pyruvyl transferase WcaK-like protein
MDPKKVATNESRELPDNAIVCAAIVEAVRRHGMKALLCAEQRSEIPLLTRALYDKLPQDVKDRCVVLRQFWAPDLALGVYRRSRCVFGIEMHSQVMALGSGIPACVFRHSGFGSKSGMWSDLGADCWLLDIDTPGAAEKAAAMVGGILADPDKAAAKCRAVRKEIDKAELAAARVVGGR